MLSTEIVCDALSLAKNFVFFLFQQTNMLTVCPSLAAGIINEWEDRLQRDRSG